MSDDRLIWWTANDVPVGFNGRVPAYIRDEYRGRSGRNGRGRLWIAPQFKGEKLAIDPWPTIPVAGWISNYFGGIVIDKDDLKFVAHLPGIVTDFKLNVVSSKGPNLGWGELLDLMRKWA